MNRAVNLKQRAFQPISGHRALDLLATLRDRYREPVECLRGPADLDRWLDASKLGVEAHATKDDLEAARRLRETLARLMRALLDARPPDRRDLSQLNRWARQPILVPQVSPSLEQRWIGGVEAALAVVAREAVELLAGPERILIRLCAAAPECSRVYLDRSPGHRRRWCHMEWCGSNAKMRVYRQRHATAAR